MRSVFQPKRFSVPFSGSALEQSTNGYRRDWAIDKRAPSTHKEMRKRVHCKLSAKRAAKQSQTGKIKGAKRAITRAKQDSSRMCDKLNACNIMYAL